MTTIDYKEKLRLAKEALESGSYDKKTIEYIFPELAESEDEKIRKDLIVYLRSILSNKKYGDEFIEDWIAWLEKLQIEKLPFEMKTPEESLGIDSDTYSKIVDECIYGEPKQEWSDEDDYNYGIIQYILNNECVGKTDKENAINWFKSLKERYTWKPSEEHMIAIQEAMNIVGILTITGSKLNSLYQDLKKLREE